MKEKLLNSYLYVFDNEPYEITTEANGIYIQEEFVKEFAYINPSLADKMIPINYYVIKANTPEWYSYMVSTEPQPAPLGPDSSVPDNPELVVDGDNITVSEYGNKFMLFSNPRKLKNVMYNSTNENVAYFSSDQEGQVEIAGPGTTMLSQEFAGDDEYLPFSKSYNLEVEDITVDPEIAWSQNSATVQIGESNSFPTISNPHNVGLTFASSDESVATVDQNTGEITLVSAGNCSIACISVQDADYYSSTVEYSLTVLAAKVNPDLSWSFSPATVQIGETNSFPTLHNGDGVSPIVYSSSNQAVATVNQETGEVSLVAAGSCYITASFAGNSQYNAYTISYELTVLSTKIDPDLHYSKETGEFDLYTQGTDNIPFLYNTYNVSQITYSSSDTTVAGVNPDGTIIPYAVGTTTITASFAGNSQYLPSSDSYVLTISDSRLIQDTLDAVYESNNGAVQLYGDIVSSLKGYVLTQTLPTAQNLDEYINLNTSKPSVESIDMTDLTGPTEFYLIYPVAWEVIENDIIEKPVITDDANSGEIGIWFEGQDPKINVSGKDYRIANIQLGKGTFTIEF